MLYQEHHLARSTIQRQIVQGHSTEQVPGVPCNSARLGCGFGWDCAIAPVNGHSACGCTAAAAQSRAGHTICNANRSSRCSSCHKISPDAALGTCLAAKGAHPSFWKGSTCLAERCFVKEAWLILLLDVCLAQIGVSCTGYSMASALDKACQVAKTSVRYSAAVVLLCCRFTISLIVHLLCAGMRKVQPSMPAQSECSSKLVSEIIVSGDFPAHLMLGFGG